MIQDNCKGCFIYDPKIKADQICIPRKYHNEDQCPCRLCLVKVVCNRLCETRNAMVRVLIIEQRG